MTDQSSSGIGESTKTALERLSKNYIAEQRARLFNTDERRTSPLSVVQAYARLIDQLLGHIFHLYTTNEHACLVALGGYGRRELCPYSDVDVLVLHDTHQDMEQITAMVRKLWDTGLTMGCVVRTIDQCASILGQDMASDTALLESTFVAGNHGLFEKLRTNCVWPHFRKKKKAYIAEICNTLRDGLFSSANTLFRVEPDLKNGICTLRDCQRLLWAERVRKGAFRFSDYYGLLHEPSQHLRQFASDYAFLTGLRVELHQLCNRRIDVLEIDLQPAIAEQYGYGLTGAGLLMEHFYRTIRDIRLHILSFLEKDLVGKTVWSSVCRRISANPVGPGLSVLDGIIFSNDKNIDPDNLTLWILKLFRSALIHKATLSVELRNRLRRLAMDLDHHDFAYPEIGRIFREILAWEGETGQILQMMHETGILGKLIPPFNQLNCKVEYDSYHEFTIDQHILLAVSLSDTLANDPDEKIRTLRRTLDQPMLLKAGLLFHDIGKSQSGDHVQDGTIMTETICERLGFDEQDIERLKFLVYHHLSLSNLSLMREPDDHSLQRFAVELGDRKTLDLLYLLTVCDIRSVGPNTWTDWKAYQLEQLYDRIRNFIDHPDRQNLDMAQEEANPLITEPSYYSAILPEDRIHHRQWLAEAKNLMTPETLTLHHDAFAGFERITVCGIDRPGFLCDLIGCLSSEGYNTLNARIYSTCDGRVLDIFYLEPSEIPAISSEEKIKNIDRKWHMIKRGEITADELVAERIRKYPPPPLRHLEKSALQIRINNADSTALTIIEIDAADNFGLLHKIARCFIENDINIVTAKLSTRADQAVDVFYICDATKQKITDPSRLDKLKADLMSALAG